MRKLLSIIFIVIGLAILFSVASNYYSIIGIIEFIGKFILPWVLLFFLYRYMKTKEKKNNPSE
jgi:hypothetical protein